MNSKGLKKYLEKHGLVRALEPSPPEGRKYSTAIIIPVYAEQLYLEATLDSLCKSATSDTIVVIVVNNPPDASEEKLQENQAASAMLKQHGEYLIEAGTIDGGVGEARKVGMDSVLEYLTDDAVICCLDADSPVESNYVEAVNAAIAGHPGCCGGVVRFRHSAGSNQAEDDAITDYELFLRYYAAGLKYAGSPYAFHTVGSTIVCTADAYVKAGGMRIRTGGEDFYFLQALAKVGPVINIPDTCVYPSSRPSERVPFGTGPKVREIMAGNELKFYAPQIFDRLKEIIERVDSCNDFETLPEYLGSLGAECSAFLKMNNFENAWRKIYSNTPKNRKAWHKAFHTWFDAFRTLKFVHFCEEAFVDKYPRQEIMDALNTLPGIPEFASKAAALDTLRLVD